MEVDVLLDGAREELRRDPGVKSGEPLGTVALEVDLVAELREHRLDVAAGALEFVRPRFPVAVTLAALGLEVGAGGLEEPQLERGGVVGFIGEDDAVVEAGAHAVVEGAVLGVVDELREDAGVVVGGRRDDVVDVNA